MKIVAFLALLGAAAVSATSSGEETTCTILANWGCRTWKKDAKGEDDRLTCTDPNKGIMPWVKIPDRTDDYSVRSGDGDASKDPTTYTPGEISNIFIRVKKYGMQWRGLIIQGMNKNDDIVGSWEIPADSNNLVHTPCKNKGVALHVSAEIKPAMVQLRWLGPPKGTGDVHFGVLLKRGPANHGYFHYPNKAGDLVLKENTAKPAARIWYPAKGGKNCVDTCKEVGGSCNENLMKTTNTAQAMEKELGRFKACALPYVSSCRANAPFSDTRNLCFYHAGDKCEAWRKPAPPTCASTPGKNEVRLCPCAGANGGGGNDKDEPTNAPTPAPVVKNPLIQPGFQKSAILEDNGFKVGVAYTYSGNTLSVAVTGESAGYIGLGFSKTNNKMIGAEAVLGYGNTVAAHTLVSVKADAIKNSRLGNAFVSNEAVSTRGKYKILKFSRNIGAGKSSINVIFAVGNLAGGFPSRHSNRGFGNLDLGSVQTDKQCPAVNGFAATKGGATASKNCPAGTTGSITRSCRADGTWGTVVNTCVAKASCTDGIKNQNEQGVDCGGSCPKSCDQNFCATVNCGPQGVCDGAAKQCKCTGGYSGNRCQTPPASPCANINCGIHGVCVGGQCKCTGRYSGNFCEIPPPASCTDGMKNGNELGIDCGGNCKACAGSQYQVSAWSACSKTCGGGFRTRTFTCRDATGEITSALNCAGLHKPTTQQSCNPDPCPQYSWIANFFGPCSTQCGGGIQVREVKCQSDVGNSIVPNANCDAGTAPSNKQECNTQACTKSTWVAGEWGECSEECGGGERKRSNKCVNKDGMPANDCVDAEKPSESEACNLEPCKNYDWEGCAVWDACTATCGGGDGMLGTRSRVVLCKDSATKAVVDPALCDPATRPQSTFTGCNTERCKTVNWMADGAWSACVNGQRTRTFHCHNADGTSALLSTCRESGIPMPRATMACQLNVCPTFVPNVDTPIGGGGRPSNPSASGSSTVSVSVAGFMAVLAAAFALN